MGYCFLCGVFTENTVSIDYCLEYCCDDCEVFATLDYQDNQ